MPEAFLDKSYAGGGARNAFGNNSGIAFERMNRGTEYTDVSQAEKRYGAPPKLKTENREQKTGNRPSYLSPVNRQPSTVNHIPSKNFEASDTSNLQEGQRVEHQKFGFGEVMKLEGSAHNPIATIKFDKNGEKKIMLNYAKLRIL